MKENVVPLLRRATNESIYFDFKNQKNFLYKNLQGIMKNIQNR